MTPSTCCVPRHKLHEPLRAFPGFGDVFKIGLHLDHRRDKPGIEPVSLAGLGYEIPPDGGRGSALSCMGAENQLRRHHARQGQRRRMGRQRVNVHLVEQVFPVGMEGRGGRGLSDWVPGFTGRRRWAGRSSVERSSCRMTPAEAVPDTNSPAAKQKSQDTDHSGNAK